MSLLKNLIVKIESLLANRNNASKIKYLRKQGCTIGNNTRILSNITGFGTEPYLIEIGDNCLLSGDVHFLTHDGGVKVLNFAGYFNGNRMDKMGRIIIGSNCFIGNGTRVLGGVKVGNNCIIGTNSLVTKSMPSNCVIAGIPAKIICSIDDYYSKNLERGTFFPTPSMSPKEKRNYLIKNVSYPFETK